MHANYLILLTLILSSEALASPTANLQKITAAQSQTIAVSVQDLERGGELAGMLSHQAFKPASVMKLLTGATALQYLGSDYRFSTELLYDRNQSGTVDTLYVRGGGDPSLTLENLWLVTRKLRKLGIRRIEKVVLDDSRFTSERSRVGTRAYETGSSALSLSFNSVAFDICPGPRKGAALLSVDPWEAQVQTRGSIGMVTGRGGQFSIDELKQENGNLVYSLSGTFGEGRACETFYRSVKEPLLFFSSVFRKFASELGIQISSAPLRGLTPPSAKMLTLHQSKALSLIVEDMNHFSTNFIAEQILYVLGEGADRGFDRERGLERIRKFLTELGIPKEEFSLFDGSGLSHDNRLSAAAITTVVRAAALSEEFGIEYQKSLSVAGGNGTLRDRNFGPGIHVRAKTGTLDGVSALSGILACRSGRKVVFAILQNGKVTRENAATVEEKIISELYRSF